MKQFLVTLVLTVLVWLGVRMSDRQSNTIVVAVDYDGYDDSRFARARADSLLTLRVESSGFSALLYSIVHRRHPAVVVGVDAHVGYQAVAVSDQLDVIAEQLHMAGDIALTSPRDSLRLVLVERLGRDFAPDIAPVRIAFAEGYGLYGQPQLRPATVRLYGPQRDLDAIASLRVADTVLDNLIQSGTFKLRLAPDWGDADIHPSTTEVELYLPVARYVEREYRLPVRVSGGDSSVRLRLYPAEVVLTAWVAEQEADRVSPHQFEASINYDEVLSGSSRSHQVYLTSFPEHVRPHGLVPAEVQCVIIK